MGTLPLGTGNDLSRTLKCGAKYNGGGLHKVLTAIAKCGCVQMDRWTLKTSALPAEKRPDPEADKVYDFPVQSEAPQAVWNNYFSIGSDAYIALKFHLNRERQQKAGKSQSRLKNKATYGLLGAKEYGRFNVAPGCFSRLSLSLSLSTPRHPAHSAAHISPCAPAPRC